METLNPNNSIENNKGLVKTIELPIFTRQSSKLIDGVWTQVICQCYGDTILILISQLGKVGYLTQISIPTLVPLQTLLLSPPNQTLPRLPIPPAQLQQTSLLGLPPPESSVFYDTLANQVATLVFYKFGPPSSTKEEEEEQGVQGRKVVTVGLALDRQSTSEDRCRSTFEGVISLVLDCRVW